MSIYYDEDWEVALICDGTNSQGWTLLSNGLGCPNVAISTDFAQTGTHCLKQIFDDINGHGGNGLQLGKSFGASTTLCWGRMYFRTAAGFQVGSNGFSKILMNYDESGQTGLLIWLQNMFGWYGITCELMPSGPVTTHFRSTVVPSTSSFDLVEWELFLGTANQSNGYVKLYINGSEVAIADPSGQRPSNVNIPLLGASGGSMSHVQVYRQSGLGITYMDRLANGNTRIGAVGSETTPPAAPTGVTVS